MIKTNGTSDGTRRVSEILGAELRVTIDRDESDGIISDTDFTTVSGEGWYSGLLPITDPVGVASDSNVNLNLRDHLRRFLLAGKSRMSLRLSLTNRSDNAEQNNLRIDIATDLAAGATSFGVPTKADSALPGTTRLVVTPEMSRDVTFDLLDVDGQLLADNVTTTDMRHLDAGTYYLHVSRANNFSLSTPVSFAMSLQAPAAGQTRVLTSDPDRDIIHGGDGNDVIIGGADFDRLYGDAGTDVMVADTLASSAGVLLGPEIRDAAPETIVNSASADSLANYKVAQLDPVVTIPDKGLRLAIADALGIAKTEQHTTKEPRLARDIRASDLATLTNLDASSRDIRDLSGLEFATNLRVLNLANNRIVDLSALQVRTLMTGTSAGTSVGLRSLEFLSLDNNIIQDLTSVTSLTQLVTLSADSNFLSALPTLSNLKSLKQLSVDGKPFTETPTSSSFRLNSRGIRILESTVQNARGIVKAGVFDYTTTSDIVVMRTRFDGTMDTNFGTAGTGAVTIPASVLSWNGWIYVGTLMVDAQQRIIVTGSLQDSTSIHRRTFAIRLTPDGLLDSTFNGNGIRVEDVTPDSASHEVAYAAAVYPDGKILIGSRRNNVATVFLRLTVDGKLDQTFIRRHHQMHRSWRKPRVQSLGPRLAIPQLTLVRSLVCG